MLSTRRLSPSPLQQFGFDNRGDRSALYKTAQPPYHLRLYSCERFNGPEADLPDHFSFTCLPHTYGHIESAYLNPGAERVSLPASNGSTFDTEHPEGIRFFGIRLWMAARTCQYFAFIFKGLSDQKPRRAIHKRGGDICNSIMQQDIIYVWIRLHDKYIDVSQSFKLQYGLTRPHLRSSKTLIPPFSCSKMLGIDLDQKRLGTENHSTDTKTTRFHFETTNLLRFKPATEEEENLRSETRLLNQSPSSNYAIIFSPGGDFVELPSSTAFWVVNLWNIYKINCLTLHLWILSQDHVPRTSPSPFQPSQRLSDANFKRQICHRYLSHLCFSINIIAEEVGFVLSTYRKAPCLIGEERPRLRSQRRGLLFLLFGRRIGPSGNVVANSNLGGRHSIRVDQEGTRPANRARWPLLANVASKAEMSSSMNICLLADLHRSESYDHTTSAPSIMRVAYLDRSFASGYLSPFSMADISGIEEGNSFEIWLFLIQDRTETDRTPRTEPRLARYQRLQSLRALPRRFLSTPCAENIECISACLSLRMNLAGDPLRRVSCLFCWPEVGSSCFTASLVLCNEVDPLSRGKAPEDVPAAQCASSVGMASNLDVSSVGLTLLQLRFQSHKTYSNNLSGEMSIQTPKALPPSNRQVSPRKARIALSSAIIYDVVQDPGEINDARNFSISASRISIVDPVFCFSPPQLMQHHASFSQIGLIPDTFVFIENAVLRPTPAVTAPRSSASPKKKTQSSKDVNTGKREKPLTVTKLPSRRGPWTLASLRTSIYSLFSEANPSRMSTSRQASQAFRNRSRPEAATPIKPSAQGIYTIRATKLQLRGGHLTIGRKGGAWMISVSLRPHPARTSPCLEGPLYILEAIEFPRVHKYRAGSSVTEIKGFHGSANSPLKISDLCTYLYPVTSPLVFRSFASRRPTKRLAEHSSTWENACIYLNNHQYIKRQINKYACNKDILRCIQTYTKGLTCHGAFQHCDASYMLGVYRCSSIMMRFNTQATSRWAGCEAHYTISL
ncbi:uncharacterized protein BDR25DRAFT_351518 [Lindgomyces ingoldianus]|uniref:Uncharacterized protein n=1 Tax=Lindgomyces ingoldianus TaxID=673940 RepID=A0ACB6R7K3_9PLEO|nr:uncharacterized protein BDR25DRAFT_351518 [Lindgomyces ingoldianus]KAF2475035.1 hypothetical protein BDR25DRAFT_351518 [Lindgomyces ingoldianus]